MVTPIRVVIADDDVLLREGLASLLERAGSRRSRHRHPGAVGACRIEHAVELLASGHRIGYLLKSRITDVTDFIEIVESIAGLWVTEGTVEKHVRSILTKLDLSEASDDHRRVLAVITFLEDR